MCQIFFLLRGATTSRVLCSVNSILGLAVTIRESSLTQLYDPGSRLAVTEEIVCLKENLESELILGQWEV